MSKVYDNVNVTISLKCKEIDIIVDRAEKLCHEYMRQGIYFPIGACIDAVCSGMIGRYIEDHKELFKEYFND